MRLEGERRRPPDRENLPRRWTGAGKAVPKIVPRRGASGGGGKGAEGRQEKAEKGQPKEPEELTTGVGLENYDGFVASNNSEVFHRAGCRGAARIASTNLLRYSGREEAIQDGKKPCAECKP
jgi:hypothetical protein